MSIADFFRELWVELPPRLAESELRRVNESALLAASAAKERFDKLAAPLYDAWAKNASKIDPTVRAFGVFTPRIYDELERKLHSSEPFAKYLMRLVNEKYAGRAAMCYKCAGLSRQHYSSIIGPHSHQPERTTVMRLAIGLKLSYPEAVKLMAAAGYVFRNFAKEDAVFATCIQNGVYNIFDVNDVLVAAGLRPMSLC